MFRIENYAASTQQSVDSLEKQANDLAAQYAKNPSSGLFIKQDQAQARASLAIEALRLKENGQEPTTNTVVVSSGIKCCGK